MITGLLAITLLVGSFDMNMSNLRAKIRRHEGRRLAVYIDSEGHRSIGYGYNLDSNPMPNYMHDYLETHGQIAEYMAEDLLTISIDRAIKDARCLFPNLYWTDDVRQEALINLVFNMGYARVKNDFPNFIAAINRRDFQRAADELKYVDGLKKDRLSMYWSQLHGDTDGTDDGIKERPEEIYHMIQKGAYFV